MAVQTINVGNIANDGTGDDLRDAFIKINQNFDDLDLRSPEAITATNTGTGEGVFKSYAAGDFEFRSIAGGIGITVANDGDTITVNSDPIDITIISDSGSRIVRSGSIWRIFGGTNADTHFQDGDLYISSQTVLETDGAPRLSADVNAQQNNITNVNLIGANNVTSLVHGVDIRELNKYFEGFDFGSFDPIENYIDWLLLSVDVDMGEFLNPSQKDINLGFIV